MDTQEPTNPESKESTEGVDAPDAGRRGSAKGNSLTKGVMASWLGYVVVVVSGFILPRMIDHTEGQSVLGIWDFGWALVANVNLLSLGVGSAVNRYVARARAANNTVELNATVNAAMVLLLISFAIGFLAVIGMALLTPLLVKVASEQERSIAVWLVVVLGLAATLKLPFGCVNGVITGCERFDLLNLIRGTRDVLVLVIGFAMLYAGWGLLALGMVVLVGEALADGAKLIIAHRLCPELRLSPRLADRATIREVLGFGGKSVVQGAARAGLYQLNFILIASILGAAALAVYRRQMVLVLHTLRFIKAYSQVFVPRAGSLHAKGDVAGLRSLLLQSSRYGFFATIPISAFLILMGAPILRTWMGDDYQAPWILALLAVGHLFAIAQQGAYSVLMGMGRHGVPSFVDLAAAAVGAIMCVALLLGGAGLMGAALSVSIPVMLSGGLILPWYACKLLDVSPMTYMRESMVAPFVLNLPLIACLMLVRWFEPTHDLTALCGGLLLGGIFQVPLYWRFVLPQTAKAQVRKRLFARPISA